MFKVPGMKQVSSCPGNITINQVFCAADRALYRTMQTPWQGDQHEVITLL